MGRDFRAAVAHASVGSGHLIAAEAAQEQLESRGIEVGAPVDALDHGRIRLSGELLTRSFTGVWAPLYDRAWRAPGVRLRRGNSAVLLSWFYRSLQRELTARGCRAVACTHALPAIVAAEMRRHGADIGVVAVLTDFDAHSQWPRDLDAYCVPCERAQASLVKRGVPEDRISITGIPLRSEFRDALEASPPRADRTAGPSILVLAGAGQPGPYRNVRAALPTLVPALLAAGAHVRVVCGDDTSIPGLLATVASNESLDIVGRSDTMHRLMLDADLYVGKPGGLVCAEALATNLPMLLVGPAWGQEGANLDALVGAGVAVASDIESAGEVAGALVTQPDELSAMAEAARSLAQPRAADLVADVVEALVRG